MIKLKFLRRKAKITQKTLAAVIGVSAATICSWECNQSVPSYKMLQPIADALGCDVSELFPNPTQFKQGS